MRRVEKGSITIFAALSIMLIAAFLLALLEAGHMAGCCRLAQVNTDSITESAFAGYQSLLWEEYHLLGFEIDGAADSLLSLSQENMGENLSGEPYLVHNLFHLKTEAITFVDTVYMTDGNGKAFEAATAAYMKNNFPEIAIQEIYSRYESTNSLTQNSAQGEQAIEDASQALGESTEEEGENQDGDLVPQASHRAGIGEGQTEENSSFSLTDNPILSAKSAKGKGTLGLVLTETGSQNLSDKSIDSSNDLMARNLSQGSGELPATDWTDAILMQAYLLQNFTCYTSADDGENKVEADATGEKKEVEAGSEGRALSYELEYVLCGKDSDLENLKETVSRLLAVREAANLAYLLTDQEKCQLAQALAEALAALIENPELVDIFKYGLLAAWAYGESLLDLRALLEGDKIPLMKSQTTWTSSLENLGECFDKNGKAISSSAGVDYQTYLGILLLTQGEEKMAMRSMNLMEATVRKSQNSSSFCMDQLVLETKLVADYQYQTIFLGMEDLTKPYAGKGQLSNISCYYSYRKAGG